MKYIQHRRNTIQELTQTPFEYGVEIDIRSQNNELILQHDPFSSGERLVDWLNSFQHQTLILNVKEEGLEQQLIALMSEYGIEDYFLLDQSFPFLIKYAEALQGRTAVRVSELESIETALHLAGCVKWVWIDCFTRFPLSEIQYQQVKNANFELCLVSPELHRLERESEIAELATYLTENNIKVDAICTKKPEAWKELFC
jgi:hypothetical protein